MYAHHIAVAVVVSAEVSDISTPPERHKKAPVFTGAFSYH
jgi:hypothetical protein